MKTHLRYDNATRTETDETVIATLVRKGWEVFTPEPVVEVPPTLTAEQFISQTLSPFQILGLQRLEMALLSAGNPLGPHMSAMKQWLEGLLLQWSADPTPKPADQFAVCPSSYEAASAEAVSDLSAQ